jgi:hypothetical protein
MRTTIHALEERMDSEPDTIEAQEIVDLRSKLLTLDAVVSDQLPPLRALGATDKPFFKLQEAQEYLNCALANLQAADRSVDRLGERISALAEICLRLSDGARSHGLDRFGNVPLLSQNRLARLVLLRRQSLFRYFHLNSKAYFTAETRRAQRMMILCLPLRGRQT